MRKMKNLLIVMGAILITSCSSTKSLVYQNANTKEACDCKNGVWYNNKCWTEYDDNGVSSENIDSVVNVQIKIIEKGIIKVNDQSHKITFFFPMQEEKQLILVTSYKVENKLKTLLHLANNKDTDKSEFIAQTYLFSGNLDDVMDGHDSLDSALMDSEAKGESTISVNNKSELDFTCHSHLKTNDLSESYEIDYSANATLLGAGTSELTIKDNNAYLSGDLGTISYLQIKNLIENHPEVRTVILGKIKGSLNDQVNMHTGRILHEAGLNTKVLADSDIASGGVDLFCAGIERIVEKGAKIGIHSWCCLNGLTAIEIPFDHPAHKYQISYFTMALGEQNGPNFYFHTLEAAPFDGVHWMSDDDLIKWNVATQFITK
ncbi:hypothetical protein ACXR6G_12110 [Ancylomarina sp. YFZ004]